MKWQVLTVVILGLGSSIACSGVHTQAPAHSTAPAEVSRSGSGCEKTYSPRWQPVRERDNSAVAAVPRPAKGKPVVDPAYGTCLVRVTDRAAERIKGFARNDYSRRQAFNADSSKMFVYTENGTWHLYDARNYRYMRQLPGLAGDAEPQWHPTDPNRLYYLPNNGVGARILELNVANGQSRTVADLLARVKKIWPGAHAAWTRSEGSPSADARYWAFQIDDVKWNGLGMISYDLAEDRILASYDFKARGKTRPDHISMSPSGNYVVVSWVKPHGTLAFKRDFSGERRLHHTSEHSDVALDANGDDVYVSIDYQASGGPVFFTNLRTGTRTEIFPTYLQRTATALHISGKAYRKPGWVLVSTYADYGGARQWLHKKIFAVQLKVNPTILHLAHHRSEHAGYWTEPQASVNRDFTRVVFGSNWGTKSESEIDVYAIELPRDAVK